MMPMFSHAPTIVIAKILSGATLLTSLSVLALVLMIRFARNRREHRENVFQERWKTLFAGTISGNVPQDIPVISPKYAMPFFRLWTHFHESLRGEAKERLCLLLNRAGGRRIALKWLHGFFIRKKMMAVVVLGYCREKSAGRHVQLLAGKKNPLLSLVAARALLQIDHEIGLPLLMSSIVARTDWPAEFMKNILRDIPKDFLVATLRQAIEQSPDPITVRLIKFLDICSYDKSAPIVRNLLEQNRDPDVIIACLDHFQDPRDIVHIMKFIGHPAWPVRLEVAKTLGQFGSPRELDDLKRLLADPEWQVRYEAARSLLKLPFVNDTMISEIGNSAMNPQVRGILSQVRTEEAIRS